MTSSGLISPQVPDDVAKEVKIKTGRSNKRTSKDLVQEAKKEVQAPEFVSEVSEKSKK